MSGPFQVLSHQSLRSDNDVPRDGVRKLSDVSWPLCVLQVVQRLPAERLRSHAELFLATRKKMLGHQRNVFAAFPQWRQLQAYNINSVVQVQAEPALGNLLAKVFRSEEHTSELQSLTNL